MENEVTTSVFLRLYTIFICRAIISTGDTLFGYLIPISLGPILFGNESYSVSTSLKSIKLRPQLFGLRVMAEQEDGWPLGLQPLNARVGLLRNQECSGSVSFSTLITGSPSSSSVSSSDLDTESIGSFFHDKSITLGSLIGTSSFLELSRRSARSRTTEALRDKKNYKSKSWWWFSLCSKLNTDGVSMNNSPSLAHYLEAERRASTFLKSNHSPTIYGPDDYSQDQPCSDANPLFVNDQVAPPQSNAWLGSDGGTSANGVLLFERGNGHGVPLLFSCLCGQLTH